MIEPIESERLVFQRILGHMEQPNSHQWIQSDSRDCKVCNKLTYCVFIWNKKLKDYYSDTSDELAKFRAFELEYDQHSDHESCASKDSAVKH